MDLTTMSDDDLNTLTNDCNAELERRRARAAIPQAVADLARTYLAGGGDIATLTAAITQTPEETTP